MVNVARQVNIAEEHLESADGSLGDWVLARIRADIPKQS